MAYTFGQASQNIQNEVPQNTPTPKTGYTFGQAGQNTSTKEVGGVQEVVQSMARPFLKNISSVRDIASTAKDIVKTTPSAVDQLISIAKMPKEERAAELSRISDEVKKTAPIPAREYDYGYFGKEKALETPKEAVGAATEIASYIPMGRAAVQTGKSVLARTLPKVKKLATEGAVAGGMQMGGSAILDDKNALETAKDVAIGATIGGVAAPIIGVGGAKLVKPITRTIDVLAKPLETHRADVAKYINQALSTQGKKSIGVALKNPEKQYRAFDVMYKMSPNIKVTDDLGDAVVWDPKTTNFADFGKAFKEAKDQVWKGVSGAVKEASGQNLTVDIVPVLDELNRIASNKFTTTEVRNGAVKLSEELANMSTRDGKVPIEGLMEYNKTINTKIGGVLTGTTDNAVRDMEAGIAKKLSEAADNAVESVSDSRFATLKDDYSALKSIEKDLVRRMQQESRLIDNSLGDFMSRYGTIEMVNGIIQATHGNIGPLAKGAAAKALGAYSKFLRQPSTYLQRAFREIDRFNTGTDIRSKASSAVQKVKNTKSLPGNINFDAEVFPKKELTYKQELDNKDALMRSGMMKLTPTQRAEARKDIEGVFSAVDNSKPVAFHWTDSKNAESIVKNGWDHSKTLVQAEDPNQWWVSASQYPDSGGAYGDTLIGIFPKKGETYKIGAGDNSVYDRAKKTIDIRGTNAGIETQIFSPEKFEYRILDPNSKNLENYSGYQNLTRSTSPQPLSKPTLPTYKETGNLTTKILKDLEGKSTVSKQYILDATNRGELKQQERDIIRQMLDGEGDTVNVADFAKKVQSELLPLERVLYGSNYKNNSPYSNTRARYESITLPDSIRGNVKNYSEHIYNSPIKTSAGNIHFAQDFSPEPGADIPSPKGYFGHTRIEDMADDQTRRVIEVQSDLYQRGRLEKSLNNSDIDWTPEELNKVLKEMEADGDTGAYYKELLGVKKDLDTRMGEQAKLSQYNDPTAHFRMVREEIKKAAEDGKTKLQFPTGETAMKIEGLGSEVDNWFVPFNGNDIPLTSDSRLIVGGEILNRNREKWIITDVLGDGKFKAVPSKIRVLRGSADNLDSYKEMDFKDAPAYEKAQWIERQGEEFDISGKVDTNNPIYKFYEKDLGRYLTSKYGAKTITDDKGVNWYEVAIDKKKHSVPVEAFGAIAPFSLQNTPGLKMLPTNSKKEDSTEQLPRNKEYSIKGRTAKIKESDLHELGAILYGEIGSRGGEKDLLEARVIANVLLNRMESKSPSFKGKTATELLQAPKQFQAYKSSLYETYKKGEAKVGSRVKAIETILNEIREGKLPNPIGDETFYGHNKDKTIRVYKSWGKDYADAIKKGKIN